MSQPVEPDLGYDPDLVAPPQQAPQQAPPAQYAPAPQQQPLPRHNPAYDDEDYGDNDYYDEPAYPRRAAQPPKESWLDSIFGSNTIFKLLFFGLVVGAGYLIWTRRAEAEKHAAESAAAAAEQQKAEQLKAEQQQQQQQQQPMEDPQMPPLIEPAAPHPNAGELAQVARDACTPTVIDPTDPRGLATAQVARATVTSQPCSARANFRGVTPPPSDPETAVYLDGAAVRVTPAGVSANQQAIAAVVASRIADRGYDFVPHKE